MLGDFGAVGVIGGLLQKKPVIPAFKPIDAQQEQQKAITGNLSALPGLEKLGSTINDYLTGETQKQQEALNPGYGALRGQERDLASSLMSGKLPGFDSFVKRTSAEGNAGIGFTSNREIQVGFDTLNQLEQEGAGMADKWIAQATKGPQFDFSRMLVDPSQQTSLDVEERNAKFQVDYTRNQSDAAHSLRTLVGQNLIKSDAEMSQAIESL